MCKYDIDDIKKELSKLGKENGFPCDNIPVTITNMQNTFGYFASRKIENKIIPIKFNFAKRLISGCYTEESIKKIIAHEYTHYYLSIKFNEICHHNHKFQKYCLKFGGCLSSTELVLEPNAEKPQPEGYAIYCKDCNKRIGFRLRKTKVIDNIEKYHCANCGSSNLVIIKERR